MMFNMHSNSKRKLFFFVLKLKITSSLKRQKNRVTFYYRNSSSGWWVRPPKSVCSVTAHAETTRQQFPVVSSFSQQSSVTACGVETPMLIKVSRIIT